MRFKDLAVGKHVTNNRYLYKYYHGNNSLMRIITIPKYKEDKFVTCEFISYKEQFNSDRTVITTIEPIQIPYIHLEEVKSSLDFFDWKIGDVVFPNRLGLKNAPYLKETKPFVIIGVVHDGYTGCIQYKARYDGDFYDRWINPIYFTKSEAIKVWNGLFANQYYSNQIRVENGKLIVPDSVKVGSPVYNQIVAEAKACGVI